MDLLIKIFINYFYKLPLSQLTFIISMFQFIFLPYLLLFNLRIINSLINFDC